MALSCDQISAHVQTSEVELLRTQRRELLAKLASATKLIDAGTNAMGSLMDAQTALRRIQSLDEKNVTKYAQQIASEALLKIRWVQKS